MVTERQANERLLEGRQGRMVSMISELRERLLASLGRGEASPAR